MKKLLIFIKIFATISVTSLQAQNQTFTQMFDSVFFHVSKVEATTGILYNRVIPFSGLYKFSQSDTASSDIFIQAYNELYNAAFILASQLPFEADSLENLIAQQLNTVDIGILHYKYNVINDGTIWQKLYFDPDSIIRENINAGVSLYKEETALVITPLVKGYSQLSIPFRFDNLFHFDNTQNPIMHLQVDFGNGSGLQNVSFNSSVNINYSTGQKSNWPWINKYEDNNAIVAKISTKDYITSEWKTNKGHVWIYYANAEKKLRKPILIVDGFDPENKRRFEDHENEKDEDAEELRCFSIWKLLEYKKNGVDVNFGKELLEDCGYDLVVLDLLDGGGYIERNAMVCIEVINEINKMLTLNGSAEEIVIVGPSMGGQITRFALAYMENPANHNTNTNNGKHNCRLWISYDSPHQGANISMGAQA